ncbi:hypothetical protein R6Q59_006271 [Mikania micrantha]|uniref:BHLH domain-containing protein n=1 Tax=Mikania micrantha TaxID=192012 RepID=A0A5N6PWG2_9ASTR|nr:hypothetical protein E3N88_04409 [Mikania micrantha]
MYSDKASSDLISRDINSLLYSSTFKHPADGEFAKIKHLISLDPLPTYDYYQNQYQFQNQQQEDDCYGENQSSLLHYLPSEEFSDQVIDFSPEERLFKKHQRRQQTDSESDAGNFLGYTPSSTALEQERKPSSPVRMSDSRRVPSLSPSNNSSSYGYTNRSNLASTSSNLIRQNSTPAAFLSSLTAENGSSSSPSRFLPQIPENKNELQDSTFNSLKRSRDGVLKMTQNGENGIHTAKLVHHMSLPKTSSEMAVVENFLQFQQESTVPWKTRAKRGFATHPRSIAERVRRTRISERIKRLQDLFPDMDKQSNTADMLDMAVEYIKNLQKELQTLTDARARCKCSSKQLQSR